jgi:hypothetical protein
MRSLKSLGLALLAASALVALAADSASATTAEIEGMTKNESVTVTASLEPGTSAILEDTNGFTQDTCSEGSGHGTSVAPFTGASVGGPGSIITFGGCTHTTHTLKLGSFSVAWTSGTNGTITSSGTEGTVKSTLFGVSIVCKTGAGTDMGTITGTASGHATADINAVVSCGAFVPTARVTASVIVTSPTGIGVVS